jgi:hypothetical protein
MSSVVCFYGFAASSVTNNGTYQSVTLADTIKSTGAKMNFVSNSALVPDVTLASLGTGVSKLYLVLDYDVSLIEAVYSANIGNDVISDMSSIQSDGQSYITYSCDFFFSLTKGTN